MDVVQIEAEPLEELAGLLDPVRAETFLATAALARKALAGRIIWNINSTASGGGVAEMLQVLLAYARGAEVDTRWLVLDGDPQFFEITKALHNALHGSLIGRTGFGADDRAHYERVMRANLVQLRDLVRPGDVVLLHDPQTAGLAAGLKGSAPSSCGAATSVATTRRRSPTSVGTSCGSTSSGPTPSSSPGRATSPPGSRPSAS